MNHHKNWLVSIILLNCNGKQFNCNCIDSILKQTYKNYEIIFVNNMSTDWSLEEIQENYKNEINKWIIKIVLNSSNTWFTWWNNLWVKNSSKDSEYICLLNNDTTVWEDWIENLVKSIQTDEKLWAVHSVILEWDIKKLKNQIFDEKQWFINNIYSWIGSFKKITDDEFKNNLCYTTWVHGCCMLYKKNIVEDPFEDYYFIYHEDTYFSHRLLSLWYKLWMCLNSFVNHHGSWTCWKVSLIKQFRIRRNETINYLVFMPYVIGIIYLPLLILNKVFSIICWNIILNFKAEVKAIVWIFNNFWLIKKTHKLINDNRQISFFEFISNFSPLFIPWKTNKDIFFLPKILIKSIINLPVMAYYYLFYVVIYLFYR